MNKPLKFLVWFPIVMAAVFVVAWLWIRESSTPGPYDLEPMSMVRHQAVEILDTSGWQTYRNEEYGFEFKYPLGTSITLGDGYFYFEKSLGIVLENKPTAPIESGIVTLFSISKFDRKCDNAKQDEYCEIFSPLICEQNNTASCNELRHGPGGWYIRAVEKNSISSVRVEFFLYLEGVQDSQITDLRQLISVGELSDREKYSSRILDQILSTFKFIRGTTETQN